MAVANVNRYVVWRALVAPEEQVPWLQSSRGNGNFIAFVDLGVGSSGNGLANGCLVDPLHQAGAVKAVRANPAPDIGVTNLLLGKVDDCRLPEIGPSWGLAGSRLGDLRA